MKASEQCLTLIKSFEGYRTRPYRCPAGIWTVGYGCTFYPDGRPVGPDDPLVNQEQADALLVNTLITFEDAVTKLVDVPLLQCQFDALVSFAFNCGIGNFRNSTLLRKINQDDFENASSEFARWNQGGGQVLPGLVRRRNAEKLLFLETTS